MNVMTVITLLMMSVFMVMLVINLIGEQRHNQKQEVQDEEMQQNEVKLDEEIVTMEDTDTTFPDPNEPISRTLQVMLSTALTKLPAGLTVEINNESIPEGPTLQILPLQARSVVEHHRVQEPKVELKVALLVISVSTSAIISFLAAFSGSQTTPTSKLLFRAGMLLMLVSFCSAVILLLLMGCRAPSVLVKTIMWVCSGSMVLALLILSLFYFKP